MPETTDPEPKFERAKLIPLNGEEPELSKAIPVMFNPASLKVAIQNQMKADGGSGGGRNRAAQFVEKSSTTLTVELLFDTTQEFKGGSDLDLPANSDVRKITQKIATTFCKPEERADGTLGAPKRVQFAWGAFRFNGMVTNYDETLDFFAPEGIPLRATLALTITEDRFQFDRDQRVKAAARATPTFAPAPSEESLPKTLQNSGKDPRDWRSVALYNGLESPRFGTHQGGAGASLGGSASLAGVSVSGKAGVGLALPKTSAPVGRAQVGFSFGASKSLGTSIPGAFPKR